jgi:hypothetical protein
MDFMLKRMLEFVYWLRLNKAHKQGNSRRTVTFACDCNALGISGQLDILLHISLCDQVIYLEVKLKLATSYVRRDSLDERFDFELHTSL